MSMGANVRSLGSARQGSADGSTTRDRLASRSQEMDREHPEALDLEAVLADGIYERTRGVVGLLARPENETHTREGLRGERNTHLWFISRLFTSTRPEAQVAADWFIDELCRRRGRVAVRAEVPVAAIELAAGAHAKESGEAISAAINRSPDAVRQIAESIESGKALLAAAELDRTRREGEGA